MAFMDSMMDAASVRYGDGKVFVASECESHISGVLFDHIGKMILWGSNVFPLKSIVELAGPTSSGKSALAFDTLLMFLRKEYNAALIETENKFSPSLLKSILGDYFDKLIFCEKCTSTELWQDRMTLLLKTYEKTYNKSVTARNEALRRRAKCKRQDSKDKIVVPPVEAPLLIVLDSLGGVLSEDTAKTMNAEGYASKSYPLEALKNSKYFSDLPTKIRDLPVSIIYVNHTMKDMGADPLFGDDVRSKGGDTPAFLCSHRIFFESMSALKNPRVNHYEQTMSMRLVKNSLNQRGRKQRLLMTWDKWVEEDDEMQKTRFGWEELLINKLAPAKGAPSYDVSEVSKFLEVKFKSLVKYCCPTKKVEDMNPRDLGELLEKDEDLFKKLPPYLGVKKWREFDVNDPEGTAS